MKLRLHIGLALALGLGSLATAQDLPVMDGLQLWLDATDASTLDLDDDFVDVWRDKSGNDFEAFADIAEVPLYELDAINGLPAIRFEGGEFASGMIIEGPDGPDQPVIGDRPYTAFIVNQYWGETKGRTLQSRDINWLLGLWNGQVSHYAAGWVTDQRPPADTGVPYLVDTVGEADWSSAYINGGSWSINPGPSGTPGRLAIAGEGQFPGEVSDADVSEIVVFNRALDNDELELMRTHFIDKYAIERFPDNPNAVTLPPEPEAPFTVHAGTVSTIRSAADLDFSGDFAYGINVGGPAENQFFEPLVIGDVEFMAGTNADEPDLNADGVTMTVANEIPDWFNATIDNFGDGSADDENLAFALQSIRWNTPPGIDVTLDVEAGQGYKLQLLMGEACCNRGFDITLEDALVVENMVVNELQDEGINDGTSAVAYSHEFIAGDDELNINLGGRLFSVSDNNPILHVLTLERVDIEETLGDCNGDGVLNIEDLDCVATIDERDAVLNALGTLPGDLNGDGNIDFPDFLTLSGNYGMENASYSEGNINLEGPIDFADFLTLSGNYGKTAAAVSSVPEPTGFVMGMLLVGGLLPFRKRR